MTREERFFLTAVRDHLQGRVTEPPDELDEQALYDIALSQQLVALVYDQCKGFLHEPVAGRFRAAEASALHAFVNRRAVLTDLKRRFAAAGVDAFFIKGPCVAPFYPKPYLRTMGDADIVVPTDRPAAHKIMQQAGLTVTDQTVAFEWTYAKNELAFELHPKLIYEEPGNTDELTAYFNNFADHRAADGELDSNFHFLFVLFHLRKHLMNCGVGFRMFLDVAVMTKNDSSLDFAWLEAELQKLHLLTFAQNVGACCERWFGVPSPFKGAEPPTEAFFEDAEQKVFADGVFGQDNEDNHNSRAANTARHARFPRLAMLGQTLRRIFPSYQKLARSKHYAFVKGKPWLVPFAWIYRLVYGLFHHNAADTAELLSENFASAEQVRARREMYERWGL